MIIIAVIFLLSLVMAIKLKKKNIKWVMGTISCLSIIIGGAFLTKVLFTNINYGLDLQGGFEILYKLSPLDDSKLNNDMVYNTYKAILKRIDILGVSEPEITIEGEDKIRVKLAGITNKEEAREIISSTAALTFRDYNDNLLMTSDVLGGTAKIATDNYGKPAVSLSIKDTSTFYNVTNKVKDMVNNIIVIWLDFDEKEDSYSKEKAICGSLSNSKCLSAASVNEAFASDVIIQGNFTIEEAKSLVELINSGALPTKLEEISSRTVAATYGEKSLNKTLLAGIIGVILVVTLMISIYKFSGFIASMCIVIYTILSFFIFYLIDGVLTLPGIAAMLLGIGMAVDASVISYERIKDQLKIGKTLKTAFELGNKESFSSIIDANITTLIIAVVLFILGQSSIKGFATMLIINIIVTILIMVFFEKYVLKLFVKTNFFDNKFWFFIGLNKKKIKKQEKVIIPYQKLEFVKSAKYFISITIFIIVLGSGISIFKGFNFGVDFTGGTSITIEENKNTSVENLKIDLENRDYTIKKTENSNDTITISINEMLNKDDIKELTFYLNDKYEVDSDIFVVSQIVKQELIKNAILSLIIASIGIVIYVSVRFKLNYAVGGIIALIHDVIMTILFFCITNLEINSIFIAAILTIIGYSINDTIVTFDMIRTLYKEGYNSSVTNAKDLVLVVNKAVRLTFFRSILTSTTTILPVICLLAWGAKEIVNFNIALFIGFIVGVYSSIFISNQIWLYLELRNIKKPKKKKKTDDIEEFKVPGINC